jgi:hypothetical protein
MKHCLIDKASYRYLHVWFFCNELPPNQRDRKSPNFLPWDPAGTGRVSAVGRCRVKSPPDIVRLGLVRRMLVVGSRAPPFLACRALRTAAACAGRGHARLRRYCCESEAAAERRWAEPSSAGRRCRGREQPSQRARARCSEEHRQPAALYRAIESRGPGLGRRRACLPSAAVGSGDLAVRREVTDSVAIWRRSTWRSQS